MTEKYKIEHTRDECIGCGACACVAPDYWTMESDGKSSIKNAEKTTNGETLTLETDFDINKESAESCPVNCIHIVKINDDNSEERVI